MPKINTSVITDKSITKEKLNDELQKKINNIGNLHYLHTNDKNTLVNSINELYNNTVNGKNLIGQAITQKGVSASGNDSYQTLHDKILQISTGNYELVTGNLESRYATQIKYRSINGHHKWMVDGVFRLYNTLTNDLVTNADQYKDRTITLNFESVLTQEKNAGISEVR